MEDTIRPIRGIQCVILQMHAGRQIKHCIKTVISLLFHSSIYHINLFLFDDESLSTFCHLHWFHLHSVFATKKGRQGIFFIIVFVWKINSRALPAMDITFVKRVALGKIMGLLKSKGRWNGNFFCRCGNAKKMCPAGLKIYIYHGWR